MESSSICHHTADHASDNHKYDFVGYSIGIIKLIIPML